ncbi:MAG: hypothetical protein IT441_03575 [Phycisphaeraceae bacterium]|nr:hypothetical protein [Phycisphaeraceae bacterium]
MDDTPKILAQQQAFRAGVAELDITPDLDIQIGGDIGHRRPVERILDPLFARALVLEAQGRRYCLVSMDLIAVTEPWTDHLRQTIADRWGFDRSAVLIHAVQNHAAPDLGVIEFAGRHPWTDDPALWWLWGGDERYIHPTVERILTAVDRAMTNLQPAWAQIGRGVDGRSARNRRFVMRDGTAKCHPRTADPNILHCEGPIDPEVGLLLLHRQTDDLPIAALLHHTCHPCHFFGANLVSAGWPGAWAQAVRQFLGRDCIPLVLNGACGNIHHTDHLDVDYNQDRHAHERMGQKLADTTRAAFATAQPLTSYDFTWTSRRLSIPLRPLDRKLLAAAEKLLAEHPTPIWRDGDTTQAEWDWMYAVWRVDYENFFRQRQGSFPYEIQALRLGPLAVLGWPGEPFVEAQLHVKLESPAAFTWPAHMTSADAGYIPTRHALRRGGYETDAGVSSKLAPEALETIEYESLAMLRELFPTTP